ncbi:MAG: B12-binding domain-containing radical SAM protein [Proteobacteria bacterium]|nr:B12-binding domain-containing radical SAM protein [Pseudomonadota bacterium]
MATLKRILLVYPEIPGNTYWSFKYALKFIDKKSSMPPLGLLTLAALFPDDITLKLVDMNIEKLADQAILKADAVFISAMIIQKDSTKQLALRCKKLGRTVVLGGPYPTGSYQDIDFADHMILGEVEETLKPFLIDMEQGQAKPIYFPGKHPDITDIPVPRFDLLNFKAYGSMAIQYSRGCPYTCEFCDIWKTYGNKPRLKNHASLIREIDTLYRLGWRGAVFVVDDNFIGNKQKVKTHLLPALAEWQKNHRYPFRFFTEASINLADDEELLSAMRNAGFNEVFVGIETPEKEALMGVGKKQNLATDMAVAVRKIQSCGLEVMGGFILGFDSDTKDTFQHQINFISRTAIPKAMVGLLSALPGTTLYHRLEKENRIISSAYGNNTHSMTTNFITTMDTPELKKGYAHVLSFLYGSNLKNYFSRCSDLLDNLGHTTYFQRNIGVKEIIMLAKSLAIQPFTRYGTQYIKFMVRNFIKHRNLFGEAVRCCITGHHFHVITREMMKMHQLESWLENSYISIRDQLKACTATVGENSSETRKQITELWEQTCVLMKKARKKIKHVHRDFRNDIQKSYWENSNKIKRLFDGLIIKEKRQ